MTSNKNIFNTVIIGLIFYQEVLSIRRSKKLKDEQVSINLKINQIMATEQENEQRFMRAFQSIDTATNNLAAQVREMQIELKAQPGLTPEFTDSFAAKLEDVASRLNMIGTSPDNPTPGVSGSSTTVPLGQGQDEPQPAPEPAPEPSTEQPTNEPTAEPSNPAIGIGTDVDQQQPEAGNGTIPDDDKKEGPLPGDTTIDLNNTAGQPQVGAQPDANGGELQTNPNKDDNPNNDEVIPGADVPTQAPVGPSDVVDSGAASDVVTGQ